MNLQTGRAGLRAILICLSIVFGTAMARAGTQYTSPDGHWTLMIPDGWKTATPAQLKDLQDKTKNALSGRMNIPSIQFDLMIVPKTLDGSFAIVQSTIAMPPGTAFEDLARGWKIGVEAGLKRGTGAGTDITMRATDIDSKRKRVSVSADMAVINGASLHLDSTSWFGKSESIAIHMYSPKGTVDAHRAMFNDMKDSFQFTPGHEYDFSASASGAALFGRGVAVLVFIGVGGIIWLVRRAVQ